MASRSTRAGSSEDAHMGPIPLKGGRTLTAADRDDIYARTGVSCAVRYRAQWQERCLSLSGPAAWLTEAKRLADEKIKANGNEGGRRGPPVEELAADMAKMKQSVESWNSWTASQIGELQHNVYQLGAGNEKLIQGLQQQVNQMATTVSAALQVAEEARSMAIAAGEEN